MANLDGVDRSHYERFKIQPIEFVRANNLPWDQGEIIKYICRHPYKNGLEDLRKARDILNRMIGDAQQKTVLGVPIAGNRATVQKAVDALAEQCRQNVNRPFGWLDPWPPTGDNYPTKRVYVDE